MKNLKELLEMTKFREPLMEITKTQLSYNNMKNLKELMEMTKFRELMEITKTPSYPEYCKDSQEKKELIEMLMKQEIRKSPLDIFLENLTKYEAGLFIYEDDDGDKYQGLEWVLKEEYYCEKDLPKQHRMIGEARQLQLFYKKWEQAVAKKETDFNFEKEMKDCMEENKNILNRLVD